MKTASKILILLLIAALLCGCSNNGSETDPTVISVNGDAVTIYGSTEEETEPSNPEDDVTEPTEQYPYDFTLKSFFDVEDCFKYAPIADIGPVTEGGSFYQVTGDSTFNVGQGSVSDGTYGYFMLSSGVDKTNSMIIKIDLSTWTEVGRNIIATEHCNGIAYNPGTNRLVVAHCSPSSQVLSIVNPDTLEVEEVVTTATKIQSITYNAKHGMYVVRISSSFDFALLDEDFNQVSYCKGIDSTLGKQCIACDDDYIYILDSGVVQQPGTEGFLVYDWDGNYMGVYRVNSFAETESILIHNGEYYITFYQAGARVYKMDFDKSLLPW